jgi:hypothetical protein
MSFASKRRLRLVFHVEQWLPAVRPLLEFTSTRLIVATRRKQQLCYFFVCCRISPALQMTRSTIFAISAALGSTAAVVSYTTTSYDYRTIRSSGRSSSTSAPQPSERIEERVLAMMRDNDPYDSWRSIGDILIGRRYRTLDEPGWSRWRAVGDKLKVARPTDPWIPYYLRWHERSLNHSDEALGFAKEAAALQQALGAPGNDHDASTYYYNLACFHSLARQSDEALGALKQAIDHGWRDHRHASTDPDLQRLKRDRREEFEAILAPIGGVAEAILSQ